MESWFDDAELDELLEAGGYLSRARPCPGCDAEMVFVDCVYCGCERQGCTACNGDGGWWICPGCDLEIPFNGGDA
jgi:hypothetical protein